jgi:hypothetical protein
MKSIHALWSVLVCAMLASAHAMPPPLPTTFPVLDKATTTASLIVADLSGVGAMRLAKLSSCDSSGATIPLIDSAWRHPCTDAAPYAFQALAVTTIHGAEVQGTPLIATSAVQGLRNFNHGNKRHLLLMLSDGTHAVMPRHARSRVWTDKEGQQFMVMDTKAPPAFLPCSVASLVEQLRHDTLAPPEHGWGSPYPDTRADAGEQVTVNGRLLPRFGIPVARLQAHLAGLKPGLDQWACAPGR